MKTYFDDIDKLLVEQTVGSELHLPENRALVSALINIRKTLHDSMKSAESVYGFPQSVLHDLDSGIREITQTITKVHEWDARGRVFNSGQ